MRNNQQEKGAEMPSSAHDWWRAKAKLMESERNQAIMLALEWERRAESMRSLAQRLDIKANKTEIDRLILRWKDE